MRPIIKELMDVGIKNDDNLVKLATLYQRLMAKTMTAESDVTLLSDEEKEELMNALEDVSTHLQKSDEIGIEELRERIWRTHSVYFSSGRVIPLYTSRMIFVLQKTKHLMLVKFYSLQTR